MLLSEKDKKSIAEAVKRAEMTTSGEIVFALADSSGHYHHATLLGALIGAVAAAALYLALPISHSIDLVLWAEIIAFALVYAVLPHLSLRHWFIPGREMNDCVHDAAFREFYSSGLYKTRAANGVLIYLSCFEHRVVVLGDKGIHEKMGDPHWHEVRDRIIQGIRQGQAVTGICDAIDLCGKALAANFPHLPDDVNELSDDVIDRTKH